MINWELRVSLWEIQFHDTVLLFYDHLKTYLFDQEKDVEDFIITSLESQPEARSSPPGPAGKNEGKSESAKRVLFLQFQSLDGTKNSGPSAHILHLVLASDKPDPVPPSPSNLYNPPPFSLTLSPVRVLCLSLPCLPLLLCPCFLPRSFSLCLPPSFLSLRVT